MALLLYINDYDTKIDGLPTLEGQVQDLVFQVPLVSLMSDFNPSMLVALRLYLWRHLDVTFSV